MDITLILICLVAFLLLVQIFLSIYHIRNSLAVNKDMADAFKNMIIYFEKEFEINLKTHEQMQKWNEHNLQILVDKCDLLESEEKYTHQFMARIAQGLGLQRSNLEDL
jgi:hypothetical protein